ncbi:MAG: hypothetical protein ACPGQL_08235 [Thermoplasmatota archaeon]
MNTMRLVPALVALVMMTPALAGTAGAASSEELSTQEAFEALRTEEELVAFFDEASPLTSEDVTAMFERLMAGEELDTFELLDLARYMRDADMAPDMLNVPLAETLQTAMTNMLYSAYEAAQVDIIEMETGWGSDTFDELVIPLTTAYLAAGVAHPPLFLDINSIDVYLDFGILSCSRGILCIRIVTDIGAGLALDFHKTTDQVLLHTGLVIDIGLEIVGYICFFGICIPIILPFISFPNVALANDADYVHTCPANNCQLGERATNSDILQVVYDALGSVGRLRAQEWTADALEAGTPAQGSVPGGTPGVADLHAIAPEPTYYGLQANSDVTGAVGLAKANYPGADPAVDSRVAGIHTRTQGDYNLPGDATGITAVYDKTSFRNLDFDIWTVRWNNAGLGDATVGGAPGHMHYSAPGGHILGGTSPWTWTMSLDDPVL